MAPNKGAKRKSESPQTEENMVEKKRYTTRSSNRKQVNYNESDDELNEPPPKIVCSSEDDDFVNEDKETEDNEEIIEPLPTSAVKLAKCNSRHSKSSTKDIPRPKVAKVAQAPINVGFKPVSYDISKMKSELDLSDSSDSESSMNAENDCLITRASKKQCNNDSVLTDRSCTKQNQERLHCTSLQKVFVEPLENVSPTGVDPWIQNLEALKHESQQENETVMKTEVSLTKTRGKKIKSLPTTKKITKNSVKSNPTNEISVSEMLKQEVQDSSFSEDDDENWERVKPSCDVPEQDRELPKSVEITLEVSGLKQKKKGLDVENLIRLKINRIRREIQLDLHQVSLVGLLAHGYLVNKMLCDPVVMASALSVVPPTGFPPTRTDLNYLEKFMKWVTKHFKVSAQRVTQSNPEIKDILNCISSGKAQSVEELVYTCVAVCRSLGILSRLVLSLQPLPAKVDSSELQQKSPDQNNKTKEKKHSPIQIEKANTSDVRCVIDRRTKKSAKSTVGSVQTIANPKDSLNKGKALATAGKGRLKPEPPKSKSAANPQEAHKPRPSTSKIKDSTSKMKNSDPPNDLRKRSRRKSAEKPVKYEESPLDDTEEEAVSLGKTSVNKKRTSPKEIKKSTTKGDFKKPKSKTTPKHNKESSSDEYEEPTSDDSEIQEKSTTSIKNKSHAAQSHAQKRSKKIISTDSEGDALAKKKKTTDVWMEVYLEQEEQWMSVDVISGQIHCDRHLERNASDPLLYAVAYNFDLTWKDVTARYASSFLSTTRKQRAHPTWSKLLNIHREKPSPRSKAEDESMEKSLTDRPMPTSISEFKSHPLYALQRHLLKFEAIYPPTAIPVGYIRKEPVYARECVKNLHSRETWLKEAKVVRIGEKPYKVVKARPKWDRYSQKMVTDQPLDLFGDWQIEDYIPPPAVDGVVPRNAYGNVELFLPSMLPKGTKHLQIPGLNKVARRLGIDCAPAMTGWDYHSGWSHPVYDGFVVCDEHVETLMDAWQAANEEQEQREREKREKRVYDNWRRLIRGLLIRERLQAKYFRNVTEDDLPPAIDGAEKEVSQETSLSNKNEKSTKKPTANKRKKK